MAKVFKLLTTVSGLMLIVGLLAPMMLTLLTQDLRLSTSLLNFLQIGGLAGLVCFGFAYRATKPAPSQTQAEG